MRLPADGRSRRVLLSFAALGAALALTSCVASREQAYVVPNLHPAAGPEADYPVLVGEPYAIDGKTYTPEDVLNYDEVGFVTADADGGEEISASHHTLPLPSYVEVTSLDSGRTILVRVERRGPMDGHDLIGLSRGAIAQLAASNGTPARVRRVNPPEDERALLRAGSPAPLRMDTPMPLVEVLKRKLPDRPVTTRVLAGASALQPEAPPLAGAEDAMPVEEAHSSASLPAPASTALPRAATPVPVLHGQTAANSRAYVVQAAAFSTSERAQRAARALNGEVVQAGRYFRVRTGPFATRGEAEASLAKVRDAGYSDARILTNG